MGNRRTRAGSRDIPGWAQIFGSLLTAILAAVAAATWAGAIAAVLATVAALAASVAVVIGFNQSPWVGRKMVTVGTFALLALVLVVGALTVGIAGDGSGAGSNAAAESAADTDPIPVMSSSNYRLTPSSSVFTNDQDKVDLDTGCPGHGPIKPQVGPARCGENADLILDEGELFTWERLPRIAVLPSDEQASYALCRTLLAGTTVGSVAVGDLEVGSQLCVKTDKDNIVAVRIEDLSASPSISISFDAWPSEI